MDPTNYAAMDFGTLNRLRELDTATGNAFIYQRFDEAARHLEEMYQLVLEQQRELNRRFHKGYQLHNLGVVLLNLDKEEEGYNKILLAYVEDALTVETGREDDADGGLAGRTLREAGHSDAVLKSIKDIARRRKEAGEVVFEPDLILKEAIGTPGVRMSATASMSAVATIVKVGKRKIEGLSKPYEFRCFVGGNYYQGGPNFYDIKRIVKEEGFDPIAAIDFEIQEQDIHHHSLLLLHLCRRAIFEVSVPAGQLMELERCRDYGIPPLILRQEPVGDPTSGVSGMIASMAGVAFQHYKETSELRPLIQEYLRS